MCIYIYSIVASCTTISSVQISCAGLDANENVVFLFPQFIIAEDGGIVVDSEMKTNIPDVYAAGDVCTLQWDPHPQMWFQVSSSATFRPTMHFPCQTLPPVLAFHIIDASLDPGQTNGCLCSKMHDGPYK